jgi:exodeoxyribonuclease-1
MLAPMKTLTAEAADRWRIDDALVAHHARSLQDAPGLAEKVQRAHTLAAFQPETDPDLMLYSGGFFSDGDRLEMARLRVLTPQELAEQRLVFEDPRLPEMLFRYRARNWPHSLSEEEREEWDAARLQRLTEPDSGASVTLDAYQERLAALREESSDDPARLALLDDLEQWADRLMDMSE